MARLGRARHFKPRIVRPQLSMPYFDHASSSPYEASLSTYNWTHIIGTNNNRALFVHVGIFGTGTVSSIDVSGQGMTFVRSDANGIYSSEIWKLVAPTSGSRTITVTLDASLTSIAAATSYWNTDQTNPDSANNGANGTNTPAAGSVTPASSKNRVFGGVAAQTASGVSDQIGQAKRFRTAGALGTISGAEKGTIVTAASTTLTWNGIGTLDSWAVSLVAVQPPQAAAPVVLPTETSSSLKDTGVSFSNAVSL